ncbi:alpha/beta hydrolase [Mycolicibacterium sp.]|uniref:alpha/beta hydrolase n=1 Tax=Mycolicibacterium sp. TaxID=2320850 RepID=UPI00093B60BA|nr:alpha/beta hydrolase [Mycobacterium sp. SWH-M3]
MGLLDAYMSTWSKARETFGDGVPDDGSRLDASSRLQRMKGNVEAAAPDARWQGGASQAYAAANQAHAAAYGTLAELDTRMVTEVSHAADVVTAGRRRLDVSRDWVVSAVAYVPNSLAGQTMLAGIVRRGSADIGGILEKSTADMADIGRRVSGIRADYEALSALGRNEFLPLQPEGSIGTGTDMSSGSIVEIDGANRKLLQEMRAEYERLPDGQAKTDRLADITAIERALETPGSHLVYLERPADPSQMIPAATAVGDPFTADHVSVAVPGVSGTTRAAIAGMTSEAAVLRNEARDVAERAGESQNIATVAWVGYQPPPNLGVGSSYNDDLAQAGAPELTSFLHDLDAASKNPSHTTALFGHSYGSLMSGIALHDGASRYVENVVMYGSPGFQADTPAELGMNDNNFFVMAAIDDPINPIAALAPFHGWGSDPNDIINEDGHLRFRFQHLETEAGETPLPGYESKTGASGHSEYHQDAGRRMAGYNLAAILLNRPDLTVKETPLTW